MSTPFASRVEAKVEKDQIAAGERDLCAMDVIGLADALGRSGIRECNRRRLAQYLTPPELARFVASRIPFPPQAPVVRVLDPGAGSGTLAVAAAVRLCELGVRRVHLTLVEKDAALAELAQKALGAAGQWLRSRGCDLDWKVYAADFFDFATAPDFPSSWHVVISNPPWRKLSGAEMPASIPGCPNAYAAFMALAAQALLPEGRMVFIVPRSFTSGAYYTAFRSWFFGAVGLSSVHVFRSRKLPFARDGVLQETVVVAGTKGADDGPVRISSSESVEDIDGSVVIEAATTELLDSADGRCMLRLPTTAEELEAVRLVDSWTTDLRSLGMVVSTGRMVEYRQKEYLASRVDADRAFVPVIRMENVRPMHVEWPDHKKGKPPGFLQLPGWERYVFPDENMVLVRRFSAREDRRRLIAAPWIAGQWPWKWVAVENHVNVVHGENRDPGEKFVRGLARVYGTDVVETYFRTLSGHTQVNASELGAIRLPSRDMIEALGTQTVTERDLLR